jgi:hypothetical protein
MTVWMQLLLDVVIVGLLAATIVYAVILNRKLTGLRDSKAELQELVKGFAEASARAEAGVKSMKKVAQEAAESLQPSIDKAGILRDELKMMIETADSLASRLEGTASAAAKPRAAEATPAASIGRTASPRPAPRPGSAPADTLAAALRGEQVAAAFRGDPMSAALRNDPMAAVLRGENARGESHRSESLRAESLRGEPPPAKLRLPPEPSVRAVEPEPAAPAAGPVTHEARSRAERELIQAIENMR